jgi:hypothetical protein
MAGSNMRIPTMALALAVLLFFAGCGGTDRRQPVSVATTNAPPSIELLSEKATGTIHFPRGLYSLESQDQNGYYYRAPMRVYQHTASGSIPHDGGIFVSKRNQRKLRGYIVMPGGMTHIGNLSGANYQFRY